MVRKLILFLGLLGAGAGAFAASHLERSAPPPTLNSELISAPLSLASRSFARIEASLDDAFETEQLSEHSQAPLASAASPSVLQHFLARRVAQLAGARSEQDVRLEAISNPADLRKALFPLTNAVALSHEDEDEVDSTSATDALQRFEMAIGAAIRTGGSGVNVYSARVQGPDGDNQVLILTDDETSELLYLTLSTPLKSQVFP